MYIISIVFSSFAFSSSTIIKFYGNCNYIMRMLKSTWLNWIDLYQSISNPLCLSPSLRNMPQRGFSKVPLDSESILMRDILDKLLKRRKLREGKGLEYTLERQDEPGIPIDLDLPLSSMDTHEFCLVRLHSMSAKRIRRVSLSFINGNGNFVCGGR